MVFDSVYGDIIIIIIIIEGYIFTEIEFNKQGSLVTFKLLIACFIFKSSSFNNLNIAGIADFLYLSVFI